MSVCGPAQDLAWRGGRSGDEVWNVGLVRAAGLEQILVRAPSGESLGPGTRGDHIIGEPVAGDKDL